MELIDIVILALIQGITEFLPVSSSGHLVIGQSLLGLQEPGITLEVVLHFGTLLSIFIVFGRDFIELLRAYRDPLQRRFLLLLILSMIPTAAMGLLLNPYAGKLFQSTLVVGVMLLVTGSILKLLTILPPGQKGLAEMKVKDALWVGFFQGLAIMPGLSRSGSTITGALWRSLDRQTAVRYSFMLAAPAILGATLLEARTMLLAGALEQDLMFKYLVGGLVSFLVGIAAIKIFINMLQKRKFHYFVYYCWTVGALVIVLAIFRLI